MDLSGKRRKGGKGYLPVHHSMSHAGVDGGEGARCAW